MVPGAEAEMAMAKLWNSRNVQIAGRVVGLVAVAVLLSGCVIEPWHPHWHPHYYR
jgi:hypothetical protein